MPRYYLDILFERKHDGQFYSDIWCEQTGQLSKLGVTIVDHPSIGKLDFVALKSKAATWEVDCSEKTLVLLYLVFPGVRVTEVSK